MSNIFSHPSCSELLQRLRHAFESPPVTLRRDRHIVFVCGGSASARARSLRRRFLRYADQNLKRFRMFLAEDAMKDLSENVDIDTEFINLAKFEELVAGIADCIVLFPESPGSFSELGYFSGKEAAKRLLVVNRLDEQGDSFINVGPIDLVDQESNFRPKVQINISETNSELLFREVKSRLEARLPTKHGIPFEYKAFDDLPVQVQLFITYELVRILAAVSFSHIHFVAKQVFDRVNERRLRYLMAVLCGTGYVARAGTVGEIFVPKKDSKPFIDFSTDQNELRADVLNFYQKHSEYNYTTATKS